MRRLRRWGIAVLVCGLVCTLLVTRDWSKKSVAEANEFLAVIEFPPLPAGVTEVHCGSAGLFAKFVNVKFAANQEQALAYLKASEVPHYYEFSVVGGEPRVSASHVLASSEDGPAHYFAIEQGLALDGLGTHMISKKWFESISEIRHGWYYRFEDHPVRYQLYYDLDAGQFYIYWTYS
jgi:hypothetical protein